MQPIDTIAIRACYSAAVLVEQGLVKPTQAVNKVVLDTGMTHGSALDYFYNVRRLLAGSRYTRTMNPEGTAMILDWIRTDFGNVRAQAAAQAVLAHLAYYEALPRGGPQHAVRAALDAFLATFTQSTLNTALAEQTAEIAAAMALPADVRRALLADAPKLPQKVTVTTRIFSRNPLVVAEVLLRAKGSCEACKKPAPFQRLTDGSPYLEVHHSLPLALGGLDCVSNAIALCPNCHREAHYGQNQIQFLPKV